MEFRAVDPRDPIVVELIEAMVSETARHYGRIDVPGMPAGGPDQFAPPHGAFLVGYDEEDRAICGAGLKRLEPGVGEIKRMWVAPEARGRGVARALLAALEDTARSLGYELLRLDTGPKQPDAEHLYRSAGYAEIENYNDNYMASFWGEKRLGPS
jgi:GNAT superfamily N-acetyltransferase